MEQITLKVDFNQLLEDVAYTNAVSKCFDVKHIVTRNQYYDLKDSIILWLVKHNFTHNSVDGFEYVVDKNGERINLVKIRIVYKGKDYVFHQNVNSKLNRSLHIEPIENIETLYHPENYNAEYDEQRFIDAIHRMRIARIRFLRETVNHNDFCQALCFNNRSTNPWMKNYRSYLPHNGKWSFKIGELEN